MTEYLGQHQQAGSPQLSLIISDAKGLFVEGRDLVKQSMQEAQSKNIFTILIILDSDKSSRTSVLNTKTPVFQANGAIYRALESICFLSEKIGVKKIRMNNNSDGILVTKPEQI